MKSAYMRQNRITTAKTKTKKHLLSWSKIIEQLMIDVNIDIFPLFIKI